MTMTFHSRRPALAPAGTSRRRPLPAGRGLMFRLGLFNLAGLALLGAAAGEGWLQQVFAADSTGLTSLIAAVFVAGLVLVGVRARRIAAELDRAESPADCTGSLVADYLAAVAGRDAGARGIVAQALRSRVAAQIAPIRHVAGSLVILGLIGTVVGFILALSGISAEAAADVGEVTAMITRLIGGMSVALYTTLEGAILSLWLTVNHQILAQGAARLVSGLVMRGESDARG